jgi:PAS domain S-box-containing protein
LVQKQPKPSPDVGQDVTKDGRVIDVQVNWDYKRDDDGLVTGFSSVVTDITERQQAKEALRESEELAKAVINATTDMVYLTDTNGNVLTVNDAAARNLGKTPDELVGTNVFSFFPPDKAKSRKKQGDKATRSGKPLRFQDDRKGRFFDISIYPTFDAEGKVDRLAVFVADITERKKAEEALKEKEAELSLKAKSLEDLNTALRVLLKEREKDKTDLEEKVLSNVKDLVLPYIEKIKKTSLDSNQMSCIDILGSNLEEIVSPFARKLSSRFLGLTPMEIKVANLVKEGKTTKEIAEFMNLSPKTVEFHRDNIREKLGIKKSKTNLRTYLLSM